MTHRKHGNTSTYTMRDETADLSELDRLEDFYHSIRKSLISILNRKLKKYIFEFTLNKDYYELTLYPSNAESNETFTALKTKLLSFHEFFKTIYQQRQTKSLNRKNKLKEMEFHCYIEKSCYEVRDNYWYVPLAGTYGQVGRNKKAKKS